MKYIAYILGVVVLKAALIWVLLRGVALCFGLGFSSGWAWTVGLLISSIRVLEVTSGGKS